MILQFDRILPSIPYILEGIPVTLLYTLTSLVCGLFLGMILAMMKVSSYKTFHIFGRIYTSIFRGTPLLLQLTLVYFASPELTGYKISPWEAGILTFSLNSAAYAPFSFHTRTPDFHQLSKSDLEAATGGRHSDPTEATACAGAGA